MLTVNTSLLNGVRAIPNRLFSGSTQTTNTSPSTLFHRCVAIYDKQRLIERSPSTRTTMLPGSRQQKRCDDDCKSSPNVPF